MHGVEHYPCGRPRYLPATPAAPTALCLRNTTVTALRLTYLYYNTCGFLDYYVPRYLIPMLQQPRDGLPTCWTAFCAPPAAAANTMNDEHATSTACCAFGDTPRVTLLRRVTRSSARWFWDTRVLPLPRLPRLPTCPHATTIA